MKNKKELNDEEEKLYMESKTMNLVHCAFRSRMLIQP